jgi:hypothetical protein
MNGFNANIYSRLQAPNTRRSNTNSAIAQEGHAMDFEEENTHVYSVIARCTRAIVCDRLPDHRHNTQVGQTVHRLPGCVVDGGAGSGESGVGEIASSKARVPRPAGSMTKRAFSG